MKKIIFSTITVFILNTILQVIVNAFVGNVNGNIIISEPIKVDSISYSQTIVISNYKKNSFENIDFSTKNGQIINLFSSGQIILKTKSNNLFTIEKLYPLSNTTIKIDYSRTKSDTGAPNIIPLNSEDFSFEIQKSTDLKPNKLDWISILINCFMISLVFGLFIMYRDTQDEKLMVRIRESENRFKKYEEESVQKFSDSKVELDKLQSKTNKYFESWTKLRILLMKRTRDLQTENSFYRSLIINMVQKNVKEFEIDKLQDVIRENLKTYSTKANFDKELSTIDVIASILKDNENK